jgi:hypothetical protein
MRLIIVIICKKTIQKRLRAKVANREIALSDLKIDGRRTGF